MYNTAHVGGFGGTIEFPKNTKFNDEINFIIFEALEHTIEHIKDKNKKGSSYPYCIGEDEKEVNFYITKDEYKSSFFKPVQNLNFFLPFNDKLNVHLKNTLKIKKETKMKTYSLDYLVKNKKIPKVNFLSMDTKGSELSILRGAKSLLGKDIVGIKTELYLEQIYEEAPSFNDLNEFLKEKNYKLCEINPLDRTYHVNLSNDLYGKGFPLHCDGIYILDPEKIKRDDFQNDEEYLNIMQKIAFTSVVYGFIDLSFLTLKIIYEKNLVIDEKSKIGKFLNKFYKFIINAKTAPDIWDDKNNSYDKDASESKKESFIDDDYFNKDVFGKFFYRLKKNPYSLIKILFNIFFNISRNLFSKFKIKEKNTLQTFLEDYNLFLASFRIGKPLNEYKRPFFKKK